LRAHALAFVVAALCCQLTLGHATTLCVDGNAGSDANDGVTAPVRTISRALQLLRPGDTLSLTPTPEPYHESLRVSVGGSPGKPLIIEGNGTTLTGAELAPTTGWEAKGDAFCLPYPTEVKIISGPDVFYAQAKPGQPLQPKQWFWEAGVLTFRPAAGKTPADYQLFLHVRDCGFAVAGPGHIIVRNLNCERFWNDGFNIHSGSAPVWFENIRAVHNGDEGFSAHENCECYVRGAYLARNMWHGIADVNMCGTHYVDVEMRDNVYRGALLQGGLHTFTDCRVSGSPIQIALTGDGPASGYPRSDQHPLAASLVNLRSVAMISVGDQIGLSVSSRSTAVVEHCLITGGVDGIQVNPGGTVLLANSVLCNATRADVRSSGTFSADYNLYFPGQFQVGATSYAPAEFGAYQAATGNDAHSRLEQPQVVDGKLQPVPRGAFTGGYGTSVLGPETHGALAESAAGALPSAQMAEADGGVRLQYDFETTDPWYLAYPEPDKTGASTPLSGASTLGTAQAHSGKYSAQLTVPVPDVDRPFMVKFFTAKFPYDRPIRALSFWLYGDGSGRGYRVRIRDRSGECFWGPAGTITWTGWQQITWDLATTPPTINQGDRNQHQDGPPLEIVCELDALPTERGKSFTLWFDDLSVSLSPPAPR
jgi:hypothetical protein